MALTLPSSPSDGQQVTYENTRFTFSSAKNVWTREMLSGKFEQIVPTSNTSLASTAIVDNKLVLTQADGSTSNVSLQSLASGSLSVYANESDLPSTGIQPGDHAFVSATNDLYIRTASQWRNIDAVNLTPTISASISSHNFGVIGESIDITYTTNEPEGTPVTVTTSNTGITNTSQVDISHHTGNNTVTVTAGASELAGGILTISVTDGTNIGTAGITLDVVYGISFANHTQNLFKPDDAGAAGANTNGPHWFGDNLAISNNGLVAFIGGTRHKHNGMSNAGGIWVFENTSGDTANNTSWVSRGIVGINQVQNTVAVEQNMYYGGGPGWYHQIKSNADGSIFVNQLNSSINYHSSYKIMTVGQRTPGLNGALNLASFNSYLIVPTSQRGAQAKNNYYNGHGAQLAFDDNVEYMAYTYAMSTGGFGNPSIVFVQRSGSSWTFLDIITANDWSGVSSGIFHGSSGMEMNATGDKLVASDGNQEQSGGSGNGQVATYTRSGNTWSATQSNILFGSYGATGGTRFGEGIAMTKDGQYLVVTESGYSPVQSQVNGRSLSTARIRTFQWNSGTSSWDLHSNIDNMVGLEGDDNASYPQLDIMSKCSVKVSDDFSMVYFFAPRDDGPNNESSSNMSGATYIFKRDGTSWSQNKVVHGTVEFGLNHYGGHAGVDDKFEPAVSGDGKTLLIGAHSWTHPNNTGLNGIAAAIHGS
tara:strand:+ start:10454 stop:12568 length:2115 start_codon:yes stop_codon:yes gene_type:complete